MRARRTKIWAAVAATAMLATALPIASATPVAAATADLFFSEYIEGSSNNKALEIYNGTGAPVDLTGYRVETFNNGGTSPSNSADLSGSIADGDVYVITNSQANAAIAAQSDVTSSVTFYNGDDAVVLTKNGVVLDVIGRIGEDPGSEWGTGDTTTKEHTIRRKSSICAGDIDGSDPFDPATEWDGFPQDNSDDLGSHTADCGEPPEPVDPVINEFSASTVGPDVEYVEIFGEPSTDYSNLTVIQIEGDATGDGTPVGAIDAVIPVGPTDVGGLFLASLPVNSLENGSMTLLLVDGFFGSIGDDLDTDDDGSLDVAPWTAVLDGVAVEDGAAGDVTYAVALTPNYDGVSPFAPGGASRIPDGVDTDTVADWVRNDFNLAGIPGNAGTPVEGEAFNTPGAPNQLVVVEPPEPCLEITPIADVQGPADATPLADQEVSITGIVTAVFGSEIVVQEGASTPRSGVVVFSSGNSVSIGDEVCATGVASERFGQTQVGGNGNDGATIDVLSSGNAVPDPAVVSTADIATGSPTAEDFEGVLVRVEAVTVAEPDLGFGEFSVDDGSGAVRVDDLGDATYSATAGQALDFVQGPLFFSFSNYKIEPRDDDDIGVAPEVCGDPTTLISLIQGAGASSPIVGQPVSIEGVVVGDFQDDVGVNGDLNGFFVQEEDADADGDPLTSEGIFVFQGSDPDIDLKIGDAVRVAGTVEEFNDSTQLGNVVSVLVCDEGAALPAPTVVTLPFDSLDDLESVEHMYVTFPQSLTISEFFNFDRFGEMVLTTDRLFQPTAVFEPGSIEAAELGDLNDRSKITLDDGRTSQNPDPAIHPNGDEFTLDNRFRGGDLVTNATGVLNYAFGLYRIQPTQGADYEAINPRTDPEPVGGNVTVASFNVLNYFNTLDGNGSICGPLQDQGCRGADDENERTRQLTKIVAAIDTMDADVIGIIEVENTVGVEAMADIVGGLNAIGGAGTYTYIDTGLVGNDVIKVGFIYQPGEVTPVGDFAVLDDPAFVAPFPGDDKNRAALAQTFQDNETGGVFTAAVNHLKSKGSGCGPGDDDPEAGSCNLTRTVAAQVLADWLADDPTGSGDPDVMIIGDLNSYDKEDPIDALKTAGYADLLDIYQGEFAYSYLFSGELGYLDYAMANASLAAQVTGATAWHSNSDEPDILDYDTSFKRDAQDALYEPNAYRASDHDAVIVGLDVCESEAPEIEVMLSRSVLSPPDHKYRDVEATVVVTDNFDPDPTVRLVSVTSSEPDNGEGDGNTVNDVVILDDDSFLLRAERSGEGNGRTYTVTYEAEDACGNVATATATVFVPLSNGGRKAGNKS